jgi:hypothetical protein
VFVYETNFGTANYTLSDFNNFVFVGVTGSTDFNSDLVPQLFDINFLSASGSLSGTNIFLLSSTTDTYTMTSAIPQSAAVPAPLPILGLPAVLFYSRKLKKRFKASKELSSNALV